MKRLASGLLAFALLSPSIAFSDEKSETVQTHETDGKKTTRTTKVKHKANAAGDAQVKTETVEKTERSKPSGAGGEKTTTVRTHENDGKKTTNSKTVTHKAGAAGNEVKTETVQKTEVK